MFFPPFLCVESLSLACRFLFLVRLRRDGRGAGTDEEKPQKQPQKGITKQCSPKWVENLVVLRETNAFFFCFVPSSLNRGRFFCTCLLEPGLFRKRRWVTRRGRVGISHGKPQVQKKERTHAKPGYPEGGCVSKDLKQSSKGDTKQ